MLPDTAHKILGTFPHDSDERIRHSYRQLAVLTHPDRNQNDPDAQERFHRVSQAYETICMGRDQNARGATDPFALFKNMSSLEPLFFGGATTNPFGDLDTWFRSPPSMVFPSMPPPTSVGGGGSKFHSSTSTRSVSRNGRTLRQDFENDNGVVKTKVTLMETGHPPVSRTYDGVLPAIDEQTVDSLLRGQSTLPELDFSFDGTPVSPQHETLGGLLAADKTTKQLHEHKDQFY
jgi:curved DNA-binding protein CbpA